MTTTLYSAFEAALTKGDFDELRRLYAIEHELRVRIEGQNQALIYSQAHGTTKRASEPGFLIAGTDLTREEGTRQTKSKPNKPSSVETPIEL